MPREVGEGRSPFHTGERQVQERLGVRDIETWARRAVRSYMPDQHRDFHTSLPFLVAAARDRKGRPWATLLVGPRGFVTSPGPDFLVIAASPERGDALHGALVPGIDLGLLGIELGTRRRNRVNGHLVAGDAGVLTFAVDQSFGNCPQYIRERAWWRASEATPETPTHGSSLTPSQRYWISKADTFFIASGHRGEGENPAYGMDASHRGGEPGFVEIVSDKRLVFPDYAGNNHYNTIGNLVLDPRVGLLFVDFASGSLLQLTGRSSIDWDSEAVGRVPGARRLVAIDIDEIVEIPQAVPLRWDATAESVRSLRLIEKKKESEDVTSFVFEARDGGDLPPFQAGQHLPIEVKTPAMKEPARRIYSLSGARNCSRYRISVKREATGIVSRHLHDAVEVGTILNARTPAGDFVLPCDECPIVLVSAGVGITPMISMLHALAAEKATRPVWFIHGARDGMHHPFAAEVRDLTTKRPGVHIHVAYSRPGPQDALGRDYDSKGRIDIALLSNLVKDSEAHYMLCGPTGFLAQIQDSLERKGVLLDHIHVESFGPFS